MTSDADEPMATAGELGTGEDGQERNSNQLLPYIPPTPTDNPDYIVGGSYTEAFPDCCAVGDECGWFCSGTLIAPRLVITAGHCCCPQNQHRPSRIFLMGSDVNRLQDGEVIAVEAHYEHPDLDLLLLVLATDANTKPCPIAEATMIHGKATLVGFGTVDKWGRTGYGQKCMVEVDFTSVDCGAPGAAGNYGCKPGLEIVAGHRGFGRDTCHGDSGGPLYVKDNFGDYYLAGATSRAVRKRDFPCGDGGVYVRVDKVVEWIKQVSGIGV